VVSAYEVIHCSPGHSGHQTKPGRIFLFLFPFLLSISLSIEKKTPKTTGLRRLE
jgi:hypothetical protein